MNKSWNQIKILPQRELQEVCKNSDIAYQTNYDELIRDFNFYTAHSSAKPHTPCTWCWSRGILHPSSIASKNALSNLCIRKSIFAPSPSGRHIFAIALLS